MRRFTKKIVIVLGFSTFLYAAEFYSSDEEEFLGATPWDISSPEIEHKSLSQSSTSSKSSEGTEESELIIDVEKPENFILGIPFEEKNYFFTFSNKNGERSYCKAIEFIFEDKETKVQVLGSSISKKFSFKNYDWLDSKIKAIKINEEGKIYSLDVEGSTECVATFLMTWFPCPDFLYMSKDDFYTIHGDYPSEAWRIASERNQEEMKEGNVGDENFLQKILLYGF